MTDNKLILFIPALICMTASVGAWAQTEDDGTDSEESASSKTSAVESEKESEEAEDATTSSDDADDDAASDDEASAEASEDGEDADDEEDLEDAEEAEDEILDETEDLSEDEEDDESGDMSLTPPKAMALDMSALGQMDPEKELAEGGDLDKAASKINNRDWTERAMDLLELHGYYRVRPELYHRFSIRGDDAVYNQTMAQRAEESGVKNSTLAGANMRFRLEPTLNISEDIRIKSQIDFLDNVMLGSTPRYLQGYTYNDSDTIDVGRVQGWNMGAPESDDMVVVRRVWGEVKTPFGHLRFGRMGDDWGLGMLHNSGNGLQDDFGDSVDRILFAAKVNDWLIMPAFDFPNEGMSSSDAAGRPFDVSQLDDSYRLVAIFGYIHDKEDQIAMLKRGDWLINAGLYFTYQWQVMSFENTTDGDETDQYSGEYEEENAPDGDGDNPYEFYNRDIWQITPDLWFQFLYGTFHLELEAAMIFGEVGNADISETEELDPLTLLQWGMVLQIDYGLLSDALRIGAEFGYAHGDKDVVGVSAPSTFDQHNNSDDTTFSAFSFNPAYDVDLILHRHILGSVAQSYYLKGWVQYDFLKNPMGRNLSIRADVIYSRAVFADSTISAGGSANLGVELDAKVLYRSQDGFYGGISYGVLFPLGGFKGDPDDDETEYSEDNDLFVPQTVQAVLGITF